MQYIKELEASQGQLRANSKISSSKVWRLTDHWRREGEQSTDISFSLKPHLHVVCWEPSTLGEKRLVVTGAEGQGMEMSGVSFSSFFPWPLFACLPEEKTLLYPFCWVISLEDANLGDSLKEISLPKENPKSASKQSTCPSSSAVVLFLWFSCIIMFFSCGLDVLSSDYFSYTSWILIVTLTWDWDFRGTLMRLLPCL